MKLKICGIRNLKTFQACLAEEVEYLGINFVPTSKRCVENDFRKELSILNEKKCGGVFQNQSLEEVKTCIEKYNLNFVQLHGEESLEYLEKIDVFVIKAVSLKNGKDLERMKQYLNKVEIILLDSPKPGQGQTISFKLLNKAVELCRQMKQAYAIAGGMNLENIKFFLKNYPDAKFLDIASGVENERGEFSKPKLKAITLKVKEFSLQNKVMQSFALSDFPNVTPLSLFDTLRKEFGSPAVLFESAVKNEENRISVVACAPVQNLEISEKIETNLRKILKECYVFPENSYFSGGLMGGVSFEVVFDFFPKYAPKHREKLPRTLMYEFGLVCIFDHLKNSLIILQHPKNLGGNIEEILEKVELIEPVFLKNLKLKSEEKQNQKFIKSVEMAQKAIYEGEVFQLVLSDIFEQEVHSNLEIKLYSALKQLEPTTHLVLADYAQYGIYVCASPEIIGKKVGSHLLVTPIAGTRRRKLTNEENELVEKDLINDPKENAEHDMLVDLGRNDLGRISKAGSVCVTKYKYLQTYKHVIHLLSDVESEIDPKYDAVDFLRAIFPAGTLSGAPKLRAVKLIQELENCARGFYGGATGLIDTKGNLQMAINIRGVHLHNGKAKIQVGAGIVKDSVPKNEWKELQNKSQTIRNVISSLKESL